MGLEFYDTEISLQGLWNVEGCWIRVRPLVPTLNILLSPNALSLSTLVPLVWLQQEKNLIKKLSYQTCKVPQK